MTGQSHFGSFFILLSAEGVKFLPFLTHRNPCEVPGRKYALSSIDLIKLYFFFHLIFVEKIFF